MATLISNQATISYRFGTRAANAVSNIASTVLSSALDIDKTSLSEQYRIGQSLTYIITVTNNGNEDSGAINVSDDLGTFTQNGTEITPLTYVGPARLFINGSFDSVINPDVNENDIQFEIENIPANGNAQIIYLASVNSFASGETGSEITNTATASRACDCPCDQNVSDSNTIILEAFADIRIVKSVCPNPVICGGELTFVFDIFNYGNVEATEVVLTDTFVPPLTDITVTVDGIVIPESQYRYVNGVLTLPNAIGDEITVPAAEFVRSPINGVVTVTPGKIQITVSGNV